MKLYEVAEHAIATGNASLARDLAAYCRRKHGLNYAGLIEYLEAHGVAVAEFEQLLKET